MPSPLLVGGGDDPGPDASTSASCRRSSTRSRAISMASPPASTSSASRAGFLRPGGAVQDDRQRDAGAFDVDPLALPVLRVDGGSAVTST